MNHSNCFFRRFGYTDCDGCMDRMHLIPAQVIKRDVSKRKNVVYDPRVWVPACRQHHFRFDFPKTIRLRRDQLPPEVEEFAAEYGLVWRLDRDYGPGGWA